MVHFISDTHFGHANILKYDQRPFASIEEHDEEVLRRINSVLKDGDTLWHLGDVAWSQERFMWFMSNIHQRVIVRFIKGNHDDRWNLDRIEPRDVITIKHNGTEIFLSHYPHLSWPNRYHGSLHLFGHVHGMLKGVGRSMDLSANMINYTPISIDTVIETLTALPKC